MKITIYTATIVFLVCSLLGLASFRSLEKVPPKGSSYAAAISKSNRKGSLVESFYADALSEDKNLENLDKEVRLELQSYKILGAQDFLVEYQNYKQLIANYYAQANQVSLSIADSVLKENVLKMLEKSAIKFRNASLKQDNLVSIIHQNKQKISDLSVVLKLAKSLDAMEQYQKENLPVEEFFGAKTESQDLLITKLNQELN